MTYFLDLRAHPVGGGVSGSVSVWDGNIPKDLSILDDIVRGKDVLIATHGFNVSLSDGTAALSGWEQLLTLPDMVYVAVLWPSDSSWALGLDYPIEGNEAIASAKLLAPFLDAHFSGAASLSFASHGLGARMVLETIRRTQCKMRRAVLMAGAIDDTCLGGEYHDAAAKLESISVLASNSDDVLEWAFPLGNLLGGVLTQGSPYLHGALGRFGPSGKVPADVTIRSLWQIPDAWNFGHRNYLPQENYLPSKDPPPVNVPPQGTPPPHGFPDTTASWSAAFASTRLA